MPARRQKRSLQARVPFLNRSGFSVGYGLGVRYGVTVEKNMLKNGDFIEVPTADKGRVVGVFKNGKVCPYFGITGRNTFMRLKPALAGKPQNFIGENAAKVLFKTDSGDFYSSVNNFFKKKAEPSLESLTGLPWFGKPKAVYSFLEIPFLQRKMIAVGSNQTVKALERVTKNKLKNGDLVMVSLPDKNYIGIFQRGLFYPLYHPETSSAWRRISIGEPNGTPFSLPVSGRVSLRRIGFAVESGEMVSNINFRREVHLKNLPGHKKKG
jgi:hypothetical protein